MPDTTRVKFKWGDNQAILDAPVSNGSIYFSTDDPYKIFLDSDDSRHQLYDYIPTEAATQSTMGLMSAEDKIKLDGIASGANVGVTSISPGIGLISNPAGGITTAGTISANLKITEPLTETSAPAAEVEGKIYSIVTDKDGYLSVVVPWENTVYTQKPLTLVYAETDGSLEYDGSEEKQINVLTPDSALDATKLTGEIPTSCLPASIIERVYVVENDNDRFSLTREDVQNGDVVKVNSTGKMYFVVDDENLNNSAGYSEFSAGISDSAAKDGRGQIIDETYISNIENSGNNVFTATKGNETSFTFSLAEQSLIEPASYGPSGAMTGDDGVTVNIPYITVNKNGIVTSISNTEYISRNTTYAPANSFNDGLMSAADKNKLDALDNALTWVEA